MWRVTRRVRGISKDCQLLINKAKPPREKGSAEKISGHEKWNKSQNDRCILCDHQREDEFYQIQ
jgi:hypothetical protein